MRWQEEEERKGGREHGDGEGTRRKRKEVVGEKSSGNFLQAHRERERREGERCD